MMFRTPIDDHGHNAAFYGQKYRQGFTTALPEEKSLQDMMDSNFVGTEKDYNYYIRILKNAGLRVGDTMLDFGCSWGYGSYQFKEAGFNVSSYELEGNRKEFAKSKLGVEFIDDIQFDAIGHLEGSFDCFFSAHVLEHVPVPSEVRRLAEFLLKDDGLFISFTPNGCCSHRHASPAWSKLWGQVHPNFIDDKFLAKEFDTWPKTFGSSPVETVTRPSAGETVYLDNLESYELVFAAWRPHRKKHQ